MIEEHLSDADPSVRVARTHPVLCAPVEITAAATSLMSSGGASLSLTELQDAYLALDASLARADAARLHLVRMLVDHERPHPLRSPGTQTKSWLERAARLGRGAATAEVAAARATDPARGELRGLGDALAAGEVSRQHVDVAARLLPRLPRSVLDTRRERVDDHLTDQARTFSLSDCDTLVKHLRRTLAAATSDDGSHGDEDVAARDGGGDDWPEPPAASHERRRASWYTDWTGMTQIRVSLPQVDAAVVIAALSGLSAPTRTPARRSSPGLDARTVRRGDAGGWGDGAVVGGGDGAADAPVDDAVDHRVGGAVDDGVGGGVGGAVGGRNDGGGPAADPDQRTTTQRRADAVTELVRRALSATADAEVEVPRLVVIATEAQLAGRRGAGGATCSHDPDPLSPSALRRCACDAVVDRVVLDRHGAVVRMETLGRLATRAQRRALAARDGGCAFPGCSAPPSWCEAHHVVFWSDDGPTAIPDLVLLCSRHHTEIHLGHWSITVRDQVPWFVPPPWIDTTRAPVRNSLHQHITATRSFDDAPGRPPPATPARPPGRAPDVRAPAA